VTESGCAATTRRVALAGGAIHPGAGDWEAEGRVPAGVRAVAPFALDAFEISERDYTECVAAGACPTLALSGEPGRALSGMTRGEARAYCRFRGGRLPTSDEWTLAAAGVRSRRYPWGDTGAVCRRGAWGLRDGPCGFGFEGPELTGAHPDGATPEGVHDLAGNVSEWTEGDDATDGELRGGSYAASLATDLRTWRALLLPSTVRSSEVGARCAY
jgi:formylglycine-generating enzyme required for sulfatase activity